MTSNTEHFEDERCRFETGELGQSVEHARPVSVEHQVAVDDALGLQMISIRLPKSLIEDLKLIANQQGLGYQPLIRRVLLRFAAMEFRAQAHEQLVRFDDTLTVPEQVVEDEVQPKVAYA